MQWNTQHVGTRGHGELGPQWWKPACTFLGEISVVEDGRRDGPNECAWSPGTAPEIVRDPRELKIGMQRGAHRLAWGMQRVGEEQAGGCS